MSEGLFENVYNPDVLSCLASLSSDEVFTPPSIANAMLDMLPQEIFSNPDTRILDPACKSGVFLREAAKRFDKGLEKQIPDREQRFDHIFKKQLFGIAITELTSLISRRSVYCSAYPNSKYSVARFDDAHADGNIRFKRIEHLWKDGKCSWCGAAQAQYDRSEDNETHAYEFIHCDPEELYGMKFDVIISNPPYQLSDGGNGASAKPIYQLFVNAAKKLNPKYITMIIPSRWFAGGKGLDDFRQEMLEDKRISNIVDYVNAKDCFPGVSLGGGVCYFLWTRDNKGECKFTNIHDGKSSTELRNLSEYPIFVRYNEAVSIIHKVQAHNEPTVSCVIGSRNPFGLSSSARGGEKKTETYCLLYSSGGIGYIDQRTITQGNDIVGKYKVMISKVTSEHAGEPDKDGMFTVVSTTKVLKPFEVCTDSYLIAYTCDNENEAKNFAEYICTRFFRFLLLQAVSSINLSKEKFQFIPMQDFSIAYNDNILFKKYGFSDSETEFIKSMIKEKSLGGDDNG